MRQVLQLPQFINQTSAIILGGRDGVGSSRNLGGGMSERRELHLLAGHETGY